MKVSQELKLIPSRHLEERIRLGDVAAELHVHGMPLLMGITALVICIPIPYPPGFSTIVATIISIFTIQLLMRRETLWLPKRIADKTLSRERVVRIVEKAVPYLERVECRFRERWVQMASPTGERFTAVIVLFMNFIVATPLPGTHILPGISIVVMSLGLINRDGMAIVTGYGIAFCGLLFAGAELWLGEALIAKLFG